MPVFSYHIDVQKSPAWNPEKLVDIHASAPAGIMWQEGVTSTPFQLSQVSAGAFLFDAMPITRECETCGSNFEAYPYQIKKGNARYCSRECYYKDRDYKSGSDHPQWNRIECTCGHCGKKFFKTPSVVAKGEAQHCSRECSAASKTLTLTCAHCGDVFQRYKSNVIDAPKHFCSRACYYESVSGENSPQWDRMECECNRCGERFLRPRAAVETYGRGKYCSKDCYTADMALPRVEGSCVACGASFEMTQHQEESGRRYCSLECYRQVRDYPSGEDHPNYNSVETTCLTCASTFMATPSKLDNGRRYCSKECAMRGTGPTGIEIATREALEQTGLQFSEQKQIGRYIADFLIPSANLVIECDGEYWHSLPGAKAKDRRRDRYMRDRGYKVVRLTESDINANAFRALKTALVK